MSEDVHYSVVVVTGSWRHSGNPSCRLERQHMVSIHQWRTSSSGDDQPGWTSNSVNESAMLGKKKKRKKQEIYNETHFYQYMHYKNTCFLITHIAQKG